MAVPALVIARTIRLTRRMRRFEVKEYRTSAGRTGTEHAVLGRPAPGAGVLVVQEGSGWVMGPDGTREAVGAKSVVIVDPGDWVEYGGDGLRVDEYWAAHEPEEAARARLTAVFGHQGR